MRDAVRDRQIIDHIRRIKVLEHHWDYNLTAIQRQLIVDKIIECLDTDQDSDIPSAASDVIYALKKEGSLKLGSGVLGSDLEKKRDRRERRKGRRENAEKSKTKNNPLLSQKKVIGYKHGSNKTQLDEPNKLRIGATTMILLNTNFGDIRFKERTKGFPKYAETGVNKPVTVNGKKVNFVLNPKAENNTSKRVGFAWESKWYIIDDQETHDKVAKMKNPIAFTIKERGSAEKPVKATKAKAEPKAAKANGKAPKAAKAPKVVKGGGKKQETPAEETSAAAATA